MSSPRTRARWLRGALVGVSSAIVTATAHAAAGGGLPTGTALLLSVLACATVGGALAGTRFEGRHARLLVVVGALVAAQSLGHLTLTLAAGHHEHGGFGVTPAMLAAHLVGAVLLGVTINAVEYLYVVATSVLCWLRLFALGAQQPVVRVVREIANQVVAQAVLLRSGLGMRAPPRGIVSPA